MRGSEPCLHNNAESSQTASSSPELQSDQSLEQGLAISNARYWDPAFHFPLHPHNVTCTGCQKIWKKKALQLLQVPGVVAPRCWMTTTSGLNIPSNGSVWENNLKGYSVQDRKHLGIPAVCTQGPIGWHFNPIETQLQTKDTHRAAFDILLFASSHPYTSHADSKSLLRTFFGRQSTSLL